MTLKLRPVGMSEFSPTAFAFGGVMFLVMALTTTIGRLLIDVEGVIVSREMTTGYRPAAIYSINGSSGTRTYTAGATDASLPRDLPIGSHLIKHRWDLGYTLDGLRVSNFPITFYGVSFGIGISLLWFGAAIAPNNRMHKLSQGRLEYSQ